MDHSASHAEAPPRRRGARVNPSVLALAALLGCPEPSDPVGAPACVDYDPTGCAPLYPAVFDEVFTRTLMPTCGGGGSSCHASPNATGAAAHGLVFDAADATHARLLEDRGDDTFVVAGDPACSSLVVRLVITEPDLVMPPGQPLSDAELCSVATWIAEGAAR